MATGENSGAWGTVTNNNLSAIEEAIARTTDVTFAADAPTASVTLTNSNALQAGRNFRLNLIGTGTAGHVLLLPTVEKSYLINNTLTVDVSVRNGTAAGTNLFNTQTVPAGGAAIVYTDGSAVTSAVSSASAMDIATTLSVGGAASVGTTLIVSGAASVAGTLNVEGEVGNEVGNFVIAPTTQIVEVKGGGSTDGTVQFNCRDNSHGQKVMAQPHSEGVTNEMLLPKGANSTLVSEAGTATITNKTYFDLSGNVRQVPQSRYITTPGKHTAAATDVGDFIHLHSSDQTLAIIASAFTAGDIFSVVSHGQSANSTTKFSAAITAFVAGAEASTAVITITNNGVSSVLFTSAGGCIITGNIS